ncbi:MAG: hypothetical protein E7040_12570 [Lentisphaerae bacterium]|nr:hypothetical protein [Lentisphaerota bacterium]
MDTSFRHDCDFENGRKFYYGSVCVIDLNGSFYQMGRQYGALMRNELEKVYRFACANQEGFKYRNCLGGSENSVCGFRKYDEFFRGMSETSNLSVDQLLIVNAVEVVYLDLIANGMGEMFDASRCSSLAVNSSLTENGKTVVGRNYDWLPEFKEIADTLVLTVLHPSDGSNAVATFNWAGCLYMTTGMNSAGLYLGLNSGMFADKNVCPDRIHNVWMLWEMLWNCSDFETVKHCFNTIRSAAGYLIMGASADETECFQWHTRGAWIPAPRSGNGELLAAANHFATPGWENDPLAEDNTIASSVQRRENLIALAKNYSRISPVEMMELLSVPYVQGGAKVKGTMFQIVADMAQKNWYIRTCLMNDWACVPLADILKPKAAG